MSLNDLNTSSDSRGRRIGDKRSDSRRLLWIILLCMLILRFSVSFSNILSWDTKGYYLYLPAIFIYNDPGLFDTGWLVQIQESYQTSSTLYMLNDGLSGARLTKYTSGLAWLMLPFFLLAHAVAVLSSAWPADGFSMPYQALITFGMFTYLFAGLWYLRRVLLHYFQARTVFYSLIILVGGTNLLNQMAFQTLMIHAPLFALYSILIWHIIQFYEKPGLWPHFASMALLCGLISLMRPTEVLCFLLAGLWGVNSWSLLRARLRFFIDRPLWLLSGAGLVFLVVLPQLIYWKSYSGQWLYYSYDNPGEGLDWLSPHTFAFLFSFRKGWLIYTPLMAMAVAGLLRMLIQRKPEALSIALFSVLSLYVMSAWTTWWYAGGCFSSRTMVSVYPALALPLASATEWILQRRLWQRTLFFVAILGLMFLNLFQTWQFQHGIISRERMTYDYYRAVFLRTRIPEGADELLLVRRPLTSFEQFTDEHRYVSRILVQDIENQMLDDNHSFSALHVFPFDSLTRGDHAWIRARARLTIPDDYQGPEPLLVMGFQHKGKYYKYRTTEGLGQFDTGLSENHGNFVQELHLDFLSPEVRSRNDVLHVYVWHRGSQAIILQDLEITLFTLPENSY